MRTKIRSVPRFLLTVLLAAGLLGACGGSGGGNPGVTIEESRPVTVNGEALPSLPDSGADPAVGLPMPEVVGASFDGTEVAITNDGRPKVIIFGAHWCPFCRDEAEEYTAGFAADGLPQGVDVYFVSTSPDPNRQHYPPSRWLADWPTPVLADSVQREVAAAFGLPVFPFNVFVYADGTVAYRAPGAVPYASFLDAAAFLAEQAGE